MVKWILLGIIVPTLAVATNAFPTKALKFSVRFTGNQYTLEVNSKTFTYADDRTRESFEIRACNRPAVDDFIRQYEHLKKTDLRLPASLVGNRAISLKDGNKEMSVFSVGKFGIWLREVPSRIQTLMLTAEVKCKHGG